MSIELKHTRACAKELIDTAWAGDIALCAGDREGELGRILISSRGDVLNGKTIFDMMSVTKIMSVAPLFHIAMDEGKLSYDDTLGKYFPDAPEDKRGIPLWMMLTHVSGMRKNDPLGFIGPEDRAEYISYALSRPLLFTPGEKYDYSCGNFAFLGFILEKVYRKPLDLLFDDKIARPLGLKNTCYLPSEDENIVKSTRHPYLGKNKCSDPLTRGLNGICGNAGIFSSIDDMSIFGHSLLCKHSSIISESTFDAAARDYLPSYSMGRGLGYVHVDERYTQGGTLLSDGSIGHTGFSGTSVFADLKRGIYVSILTNTAYYAGLYGRDYKGSCAEMRRKLHSALAEDLKEANIIK